MYVRSLEVQVHGYRILNRRPLLLEFRGNRFSTILQPLSEILSHYSFPLTFHILCVNASVAPHLNGLVTKYFVYVSKLCLIH